MIRQTSFALLWEGVERPSHTLPAKKQLTYESRGGTGGYFRTLFVAF